MVSIEEGQVTWICNPSNMTHGGREAFSKQNNVLSSVKA